MKTILPFILLITLAELSYANCLFKKDSSNTIEVNAIRTNQAIIVDGILDEAVWQKAAPVSNFIQRDPLEGKAATEKTDVRILYDDDDLIIGARLYDTSPDSIIQNLARRDVQINSDLFLVYLDPYNDKRSGFYFGVNASGTLYDGTLYNDTWDDNSWDGVWEAKAHIDDKGWTVEMKIPFSQLRFKLKNINVWGIDFERDIARRHENDYLVYIPKNSNGFVSRFAELIGLKDIKAPNDFEILPYITTKAEYTPPVSGNPFNNGSIYTPNAGADLKIGIGSNLTLNATINPDFGQVEIDPAVINLSDVETYFSEKRPFFIEGSSIFEFGRGGVTNYWNFNWWSPNFFYSRRIGRAPQGSIPSADFVDEPTGTHILGAAKLTGKIDGDWNIGTIQAFTSRENADYQLNNQKYSVEVEPLTYYGIVRAQKEINSGHQGLGIISTFANRFFKDTRLNDQLNKNAFVGGLDGWTYLDSSGTWVMNGWFGSSYISGDKTDLISLQTSSRHYFQRPDSKIVHVDSSAASLSGYAGRIVLSKQKGNWGVNSALGFISPGFDINDLGFLPWSDIINMHFASWYKWTDPTDLFRSATIGGAVFRNYDYEGDITWEGIFQNGSVQLLNYFSINWDAAYNPQTIDIRATRGGPAMINPPGHQIDLNLSSDYRKNLVLSAGSGTYWTQYSRQWYVNTELDFNPSSNISLSISPEIDKNYDNAQWVNSFADPSALATFGRRYVFALFHQTTLSAGIRLNWTFTPKLSLQLYAQPLISAGNYRNFKELAKPGSYSFNQYGQGASTFNEQTYQVDPDGAGPAQPFIIDNPDFNFVSLRGNAVLRWEYSPGSVLYLVWTQTRSDQETLGEFQFNNSFRRMWSLHPDNIFILKFTYWINM